MTPHVVAAFSEYYYPLPGHVCVKVSDELSDAPVNCASRAAVTP